MILSKVRCNIIYQCITSGALALRSWEGDFRLIIIILSKNSWLLPLIYFIIDYTKTILCFGDYE